MSSGAHLATTADDWRIEETCFNAFPSLKQVLLGNWLLRFAEGLARRANSVNALRADGDRDDLATLIAVAEPLYRAQGLPTIFRTLSIFDPALDRELTLRGYTSEGESCVLSGGIAAAAALDPGVLLLPRPDPAWLIAMTALQGHSPSQSGTYRRIVEAIALPARFAFLAIEDTPAALAYGAVHDGLLCYQSVVTDPRRRRQGLARRVIAALAGWARDAGATGVCLEVEADNAPALALYASLGMTERYRYHYRREPLQHCRPGRGAI